MKKLILFAFLTISSSVFAEDIYVLRTTIGDHVYNDILTYESCTPTMVIKGTLTVPGKFTSQIEDGKCHYSHRNEHLNFRILVRENNEEYYATYGLTIAGKSIGGRILKNGVEMGTIEGELIYEGK
ncbi:hypothetical protein SHI21_13510 [Bacteriovorax sp. PP10]|uniref:Lipoprotein n=1 Tax=Bacteriovorax antarcticus TaxID=3088717 RepID=A0ABU5VW00_9BACT|nr:hypothetical protein [Bacteriovorax sp. PP10]MEA9357236.1 hypothetical protein [Bacteriovorax sp. PP10]